MKATAEKVRNVRDTMQCSIQCAKHLVIRDKLMTTLSRPCTAEDLREVLLEVVINGGLVFT